MDAFLQYLDSLEKSSTEKDDTSTTSEKNIQNKGVLRLERKERQPNTQKDSDRPLDGEYKRNREFFEKTKIIAPEIDQNTSEKSEIAQELLKKSETYFEDEWMTQYKKAQNSKKENYIVEKMKRGKFRFNKDHKIEILPDVDLYGKTSEEILRGNYDK